MSKPTFSILVNSSDGFEDCWYPFFTLFKKYWPDCDAPIYLNTELKEYKHEGLNIVSTKVQAGSDKRLRWSECLISALAKIETPLVLYMQEDYFIEYDVDHKQVLGLAEMMVESADIKHIGLTHFGSCSPFIKNDLHCLWEISRKSRYRVSTQVGLWRKDELLSLLLPWENGWMFEIFGTIRSSRKPHLFLTVSRDAAYPPIRYQHTGIIKGRWSEFVVNLFEKEGIGADFMVRGFYKKERVLFRKYALLKKIIASPILFIKSVCSIYV